MNAFDAAAAREAADVAFRNALKVVAKDFSVFWGDVLLDFSSCFFLIYIYICIYEDEKEMEWGQGMERGIGKREVE